MNAKELILAKINASSKFVDIYTYLLSIGTPFKNIADIMVSDIFNKVVKLTETNIFDRDTFGYSLESALDFYLNRKPLKFVDKGVLRYLCDPTFSDENWMDKLKNDEFVKSILENAYKGQIPPANEISDENYDESDYDGSEYADFDDYGEEDESVPSRDFNINPITYREYQKIAKFLELVIDRNEELSEIENVELELKKLETIADNIVPAMKEMELMGSMLGINQGMRTDNYAKFSYIQRIEGFIKERTNKPFSLMEFLSNKVYRQEFIDEYEKVKSTYNILDVITKVPHFAKMFELLYVDDFLMRGFSVKNTLERRFANELMIDPNLKRINTKEFREISNYTNDVLIYNWISTMDKPLSIPVYEGHKYYDETGKEQTHVGPRKSLSLNNVSGMASFKHLMDENIIPYLKNHTDFKDNYFIRSLLPTIIEDKRTGSIKEFYRLPLQMMNIDASPKTMVIYEKILQSFDEISNTTVEGLDWKIGDLFYLYNLLTNKDAFGANSMTRLFENLVGSENSTELINSYYNFISKLDNTSLKYQIVYNLEDLKARINKRVQGTKISPIYNYDFRNTSDFTLEMPNLINKGVHKIQDKVEKIRDKQNYYYQVRYGTQSVIKELSERLSDIYGHSFKIVTNNSVQDLFEDDPDTWRAQAFIHKGEVYVNVDRADVTDPLHEFAHILLAGLKWEPKYSKLYYTALSAISDHPMFDEIAAMYPNKYGSDLQEEVFVRILQDYLDNKIYNWDDNVTLEQLNDGLLEALQRILDIETNNNLFDLGATELETLLKVFRSALFENQYRDIIDLGWVKTSQETATLKNQYVQDDKLNIKCEN